MISVFCRGLTSEARQIITETFGFAQVGADKLRIIDLDYYDLDVTKHNFIFCIGQTIKDVCKDLVKHQIVKLQIKILLAIHMSMK